MDVRKWVENAWPAEMIALARRVDFDCMAVTLEERAELNELALAYTDFTKYKPVPLGSRMINTDWRVVNEHLTGLQKIAGQLFAEGEMAEREVVIWAWHSVLARTDIWPMSTSDLWRRWHSWIVKNPQGQRVPLNPDDPTRIAEEQPYGRFVYDTWVDSFELERYFHNAWLRIALWTEACYASGRFRDVNADQRKLLRKESKTGEIGVPIDGRIGHRYRAQGPGFRLGRALPQPAQWANERFKQYAELTGDRTGSWYIDLPLLRELGAEPELICTTHELQIRFDELYRIMDAARFFDSSGPIVTKGLTRIQGGGKRGVRAEMKACRSVLQQAGTLADRMNRLGAHFADWYMRDQEYEAEGRGLGPQWGLIDESGHFIRSRESAGAG